MTQATKKPRGYIERVLVIDAETSGISFNGIDPTINPATGETYQAVSLGLIVANAITLEPIERLYVEIKWNGESVWSKEAERVHGLSLAYLEEHGITEEEAVVEIAELIIKHWGPDGVVCLAGHNVATFDRFFLDRLLRKYGLAIRFGSKTIDTNAIGFATFGTHNSDDLFAIVGLPERDPSAHNALVDAESALKAIKRVRELFERCLED